MDLNLSGTVVFCGNLKEQREFYEDFLGQKVVNDFGACIIFDKGFSLWKLDKDYPITKELGYDYEPIGNRNLEICFETENFEDAVEQVLSANLRILHNVEEEQWGQYTIRFYDPEGNLVEIGETLSTMAKRMQSTGMSVDAICQKTDLPEAFVLQLLN